MISCWVEKLRTNKIILHIKAIDFTLVSFQQSCWVVVAARILHVSGHIYFSFNAAQKSPFLKHKGFDKSPAQHNHIKQTMQFGRGSLLSKPLTQSCSLDKSNLPRLRNYLWPVHRICTSALLYFIKINVLRRICFTRAAKQQTLKVVNLV